MNENAFWLYETFNRFEAIAWFVIAIVLPFRVRRTSKRQSASVFTASIAFIAFGITDLLEAPTHADIPGWLWIYKIICASILLACRYTYIGWDRFRFTDRYLIFALLCLTATVAAILLPRLFEP
jgi:hypothetical protein